MNANGRLTAPPQIEAVLATNSVCDMVSKAAFVQSADRGFSLDNPHFSALSPASRRATGVFAHSADFETSSHFLLDPVTAPQLPSDPQDAAASN
jgi:hypothetical protein